MLILCLTTKQATPAFKQQKESNKVCFSTKLGLEIRQDVKWNIVKKIKKRCVL